MSKKAIAVAGLASLTLAACGEQVQLVKPEATPAEPATQVEQVTVPAAETPAVAAPATETPAAAKPVETKPATEPAKTPAPVETPAAAATTPAVETQTPAADTPAAETPAPAAESAAQTFTQSANYVSPGGPDSISVSLQIQDGKVAAVTVTGTASNRESEKYQEKFSKKISSQIVGKTITEAKEIGTVAGASLTSAAFREAASHIQSAAVSG